MATLNKSAALQLKITREQTCTQPQLATLLRTSVSTISGIENNNRQITLQTWVEFNQALNKCPVQQLQQLLANLKQPN